MLRCEFSARLLSRNRPGRWRSRRRRNASQELDRVEVLAIATHGLVAGELSADVDEPALALTPPARVVDPDDDGLLTSSEIANLRLSARWVILSACNTAAGSGGNSPALSGLAASFLFAGAQSLLVSHWPVQDEAAARLTTQAVRLQRKNGVSSAEALRLSMQATQPTISLWRSAALVGTPCAGPLSPQPRFLNPLCHLFSPQSARRVPRYKIITTRHDQYSNCTGGTQTP